MPDALRAERAMDTDSRAFRFYRNPKTVRDVRGIDIMAELYSYETTDFSVCRFGIGIPGSS